MQKKITRVANNAARGTWKDGRGLMSTSAPDTWGDIDRPKKWAMHQKKKSLPPEPVKRKGKGRKVSTEQIKTHGEGFYITSPIYK
jgi:hypothetical protein